MFSFSKKGWAGLAALALFVSFFAFQSFSAAPTAIASDCSCGAPGSPTVTNQTVTSVSLAWSPAYSATAYEVWYYRTNDGYSSATSTVSSTSISFSGLTAGRYTFYIKTICEQGASDVIVLEDLIFG